MSSTHGNGSQLLVVGDTGGVTLIDPSTPLRRLNYFDGKFLRASDFDIEQSYLRRLVAISNQGLGPGVVYGYDTTLGTGDAIQVGPGLAIDPSGKVLLLQAATTHSIQALIDASRRSAPVAPDASGKTGAGAFNDCVELAAPPPATGVAAVSDIYVIAICAAEALCGQQDVYGKLCEEACVTSTDRPYRLDGVVLRAIPLQLMTPFPTSKAVAIDSNLYLRSKIAHSWYADEVSRHPHSIAQPGLKSHIWCVGAGYNSACCEVPLAVVARSGATTVFLDAWIVRRERMDAPARRYWQWTMMMRPWDVYLAQVLQFQCQLADVLSGVIPPGGGDTSPCAPQQQALKEAMQFIDQVREGLASVRNVPAAATLSGQPPLLSMSLSQVSNLRDRMQAVMTSGATPGQPTDRVLIRGGILSTPSAAYLPVNVGTSVTVNAQVRALLGDGLDLRFCVVRPDYVAHAFEEAQHMERISLIEGLDNPNAKPKVDVLVPNGRVAEQIEDLGRYYEMRLNVLPQNLLLLFEAATRRNAASATASVRNASTEGFTSGINVRNVSARGLETVLETFEYTGAARAEHTPAGALSFYYAGTTGSFTLGKDTPPTPSDVAGGNITRGTLAPEARSSLWTSFTLNRDPVDLARGESTGVNADIVVLLTLEARPPAGTTAPPTTESVLLRAGFTGELQVEEHDVQPGQQELREINGVLAGELTASYRLGSGEQQTVSAYLSENVRVRRSLGPTGHTFRIRVQEPSLLQPILSWFEVRREWKSATQAEVLGMMSLVTDTENRLVSRASELAMTTKTLSREAFHAWQTVNAHVRQPDHPAHESAIRAVRTIGTAMTGGKFADLAARRLFPPAEPVRSELTLQATLDWVLFHRRRDKTCHKETPVVPLQTRQYALYHVKLADNQSVADLVKLLERTGTSRKGVPPLDFVQIVEFAAGIHAVASPHRQVQASWQQDVGTATGPIAGGIIASHGVAAAEGTSLAQARLESLVEVVGGVAPVDPHPDYEVLTRVPDALDVPSNDGVIIVATKTDVVVRQALLIYSLYDAPNHFLQGGEQGPPPPSSPLEFRNDVPQGNALTNFINGLGANRPVRGVTLATTKAAPDAGAAARLQAVIAALVAAGRPAPTTARQQVQSINDHDRAMLQEHGHQPDNFDEVIFFELNEG